jgi:hypothetical protein
MADDSATGEAPPPRARRPSLPAGIDEEMAKNMVNPSQFNVIATSAKGKNSSGLFSLRRPRDGMSGFSSVRSIFPSYLVLSCSILSYLVLSCSILFVVFSAPRLLLVLLQAERGRGRAMHTERKEHMKHLKTHARNR